MSTNVRVHYEVQGRLKSEGRWFRLGRERDSLLDALSDHEDYTSENYTGLQETTEVRLAKVTTVKTVEQVYVS